MGSGACVTNLPDLPRPNVFLMFLFKLINRIPKTRMKEYIDMLYIYTYAKLYIIYLHVCHLPRHYCYAESCPQAS